VNFGLRSVNSKKSERRIEASRNRSVLETLIEGFQGWQVSRASKLKVPGTSATLQSREKEVNGSIERESKIVVNSEH